MSEEAEIMKSAVEQLNRSAKGRNAMRALLTWLDDDGLSLDGRNQDAVFTILQGAWSGWAETVRDLMRDRVSANRSEFA